MAPRLPDLAGRAVVVLGAGSAEAGALALALAEAGADLALTTASGDPEEAFGLRRLARRIGEIGRRALVEAVDLANGANVQVAVRQLARRLESISIFLVHADLRQERPTERLGDADWTRLVNANLGAVFFACRAAHRELRSREPDEHGLRGRIVVLLPPAGDGAASPAAYAALRVATQALVRALGEEWRPAGIVVCGIVLPGSGDGPGQVSACVEAMRRVLAAPGDSLSGEILVARQ